MSELGLAYWGITDHSKSSFQANGLDPRACGSRSRRSRPSTPRWRRKGSDFRLLTGTEVDILKDGKLDFPDDLLAELDVVIASIHQSFTQTEAETTERLIGAAQNPYVHILGHLTGRLLLEREPYKVDHRAVIDACAETGTWIELNAHPMRFDMDWRWWPYAKSKGVKCAINCDAHRVRARRLPPPRRRHRPQRLADEGGCGQHAAPAEAAKGIGTETPQACLSSVEAAPDPSADFRESGFAHWLRLRKPPAGERLCDPQECSRHRMRGKRFRARTRTPQPVRPQSRRSDWLSCCWRCPPFR